MATPPQAVKVPDKEPLITPEADRALFKIMILYGGAFFILFTLAPIGVQFANQPHSPFFPFHRFIDLISTFIILIPFFIGINHMNVTRLKYARRYAEEGNWKAVYGCVESFGRFGQRFLDGSGEAHYWLSIAEERLGSRVNAEKARDFVIKNRSSSIWATKLSERESARAPRKMSDIKAKREEAGRKFTKAKRRF